MAATAPSDKPDAIALLKADHRKAELMTTFEAEGLPPPETRTFSGHELVEGEPVDEALDRPAGAEELRP